MAWHLYWHSYTHTPHTHTHTHTHTHMHTHICLLNCPNIPLTLPPAKGSCCQSCQWDRRVFNSPWVSPPQPQIDLISNGAKKDNLHIHGEKRNNADWRVTFKGIRSWFPLISVKWRPYRQKEAGADAVQGMKMNLSCRLAARLFCPLNI